MDPVKPTARTPRQIRDEKNSPWPEIAPGLAPVGRTHGGDLLAQRPSGEVVQIPGGA